MYVALVFIICVPCSAAKSGHKGQEGVTK